MDPYDILRDDPVAPIPPEMVVRWDEKRLPPHQQPQPPDPPDPTEVAETPTAQLWSPESPQFTPPHIHLDDTEDLVSAESQSVRDPDEFRTPDSEDEGSTDVSNPYRNFRWTTRATQQTEPEVYPEAGHEDEGPTSAFQDSPPQPLEDLSTHPSQTRNPVTVIGSSGEAAICPRQRRPSSQRQAPTGSHYHHMMHCLNLKTTTARKRKKMTT